MKKSQRLNVIVELNVKNEKKALEALGEVQRQKQDAEKQLDHLKEYQQGYKDQYQSLSETGVNIKQLLEFRAFVSKLEQAIEEQAQVVLNLNKKVDSTRMHWKLQHQKTKSMEKVCEAAVKEEAKEQDKREQSEQDDRATRVGRNSGTTNA